MTRSGAFDLPAAPWLLVVAGGISFALQAALFDRERNRFLAQVRGDGAEQIQTLDDLQRRLHRGETGSPLRTLLIRLYVAYMRSQNNLADPAHHECDSGSSARTVRLWSIIGSTTHVTVFVAAMLAGAPMVLFGYTIVAANVWAFWLRHLRGTGRKQMPLPQRLNADTEAQGGGYHYSRRPS